MLNKRSLLPMANGPEIEVIANQRYHQLCIFNNFKIQYAGSIRIYSLNATFAFPLDRLQQPSHSTSSDSALTPFFLFLFSSFTVASPIVV
jgi:hypothetical protein